ncbi:MAG: hypothetical protein WKG07_27320 [Hymenobacter sp.]
MIEDMSEIILNLKQVRFKKISDAIEDKITVRISGQDTFTAGDISKFAVRLSNSEPEAGHLPPRPGQRTGV